jgi:hypothetical protein
VIVFRYKPYWTEVEHFRALYETIIALEPNAVADYLHGKGQEAARPLMRPLEPYKRRNSARNPYPVESADLWDLYALSRVSDYLLISFQTFDASYIGTHTLRAIAELLPPVELPVPESGRMSPEELFRLLDAPRPSPTEDEIAGCFPRLGEDDYVRFFEALGFERHPESTFSPFYHEIVHVEETAADSSAVEIVRQYWPGLRYGEMMFARAGVGVRCSAKVIAKAIAEQSTLYWAHRRLRRPTQDLSIGWGHNSQWRTAFRRDYADEGHYYFNVDGAMDLGGPAPRWHSAVSRARWDGRDPGDNPDQPLPLEARRELLVHRCFVRSALPHGDCFPYKDLLTARKDEPLWSP